jgi:hypothetical protein
MSIRLSCLLALSCSAALSAGCQCCFLTEPYQDVIDDISDHEGNFDRRFYSPCLDLTRIGRPDWCSCSVNRRLCPCSCDKRPPLPCPTYVHLGYGWENRTRKMTKPTEPTPGAQEVPGEVVPEPQLPPSQYSPAPVPAPPPVPLNPTPMAATGAGGKQVSNSEKNNKNWNRVTPAQGTR